MQCLIFPFEVLLHIIVSCRFGGSAYIQRLQRPAVLRLHRINDLWHCGDQHAVAADMIDLPSGWAAGIRTPSARSTSAVT